MTAGRQRLQPLPAAVLVCTVLMPRRAVAAGLLKLQTLAAAATSLGVS